ncbi:universal stress protein [Marinobacter sp. TBZ242]|uniref:Universal stress protein n=1 Tax=Marinobacter azerbaijanicus TaxID=3050455 RepID=A0ABT7IHA9_9GAMM|nr:universal stress protein [Marinobacter sp. TBZ242]MDL0433567.1 universal stress protein [Marinobacter sp. TBZ242]
MTDTGRPAGQPPAGGRILVLIDGSRTSYGALEAAADIAGKRDADILGVFVEELNLLRSAGYGFSREVGSASGISRPLDPEILQRRMRRLADHARAALAGAVKQHGGRAALSVARGRVIDEVLALAGPDDLLVLGRAGWSSPAGARLGSTARGLIQQSPGQVLLWCEQKLPSPNRVVVFLNDHDEANHRATLAAAEISRHYHQPVTIILGNDGEPAADQLDAIRQDLDVLGAGTRLRIISDTDPVSIARMLREERASQLVISRRCALFDEPGAEHLLAALNLPVTVTP